MNTEILRQIIKEEISNQQLYVNDCKPGHPYLCSTPDGNTWKARFVKWTLQPGPVMVWYEFDGEWEAFMYDGKMCVGSSAEELLIIREIS